MASEKIKFSICIPYYNCSEFINQAFQSILDQSYKNWEVIVFNDGSTKEEAAKLNESIKVLGQKARIINSENVGLFAARCNMFDSASGDVILSLDSDDAYTDNNMLEIIAYKIKKTKCDLIIFNSTRSLKKIRKNQNYLPLCPDKDGIVDIHIARSYFCCYDQMNNLAFKGFTKKLYEKANFDKNIKLNMAEDRMGSSLLLDKCTGILLIDKPFYYYRINKKSMVFKKFSIDKIKDQIYSENIVDGYAKKWDIKEYNHVKNNIENIIYGDILYVYNGIASRKDRHNAYRDILSLDFVQDRLSCLNKMQIMKHKCICCKLFSKNKFFELDLTFCILNILKLFK